MSLKINDTNFEQYKKAFEIIWRHVSTLPDSNMQITNPVDVLTRWEKKSKSIAKRGLKEGLRDLIVWLKDFPLDFQEAVNSDLEKNNLPNIKTLQSIISDTINKVLKRKKNKNLDEYYMIKEIIIDQTSDIAKEDRSILDKYMVEYEFQIKKQL
jgi:hypothetical protein